MASTWERGSWSSPKGKAGTRFAVPDLCLKYSHPAPRGKHSAAIATPEPSRPQARHVIEALPEAATTSGFLAAPPDTLLSVCARYDPVRPAAPRTAPSSPRTLRPQGRRSAYRGRAAYRSRSRGRPRRRHATQERTVGAISTRVELSEEEALAIVAHDGIYPVSGGVNNLDYHHREGRLQMIAHFDDKWTAAVAEEGRK